MARVWADSKHSGSHLLMLLAIADFADDDGNAYPAVNTLAEKCRMKPRNAQVILSTLRQSGELEVRENEGPRGTNLYRISTLQGAQGNAGVGVQSLAGVGAQELAGVQTLAGVQGNARRGAKACAKPLQGLAPEPSLNHQQPSSLVRSAPKSARAKNEHPLFAQFWTAYPRKAARAKALQAFAALNPSPGTLKAMVAAISAQGLAERCSGPDARFVPHPATWLNGRRWEDQPEAPSSAPCRPVLHADDMFTGER